MERDGSKTTGRDRERSRGSREEEEGRRKRSYVK